MNRREFITLLGGVAAADAGAAAHDANGWRSGGAASRMRAWPCPMLMTRRKIIAQTMIGNETRPIKAKLRNASCLWDTHQRNLWVLDFIRRSPPRERQRSASEPSVTEMRAALKLGRALARCSGPNQQHDFSAAS
jgi:hypothetical protein